MRRIGAVAILVGTLACAHRTSDTERAADASVAEDVVSSLEVKVGRDSVTLVLHATNPTAAPVTLEFNTGQRYDFSVLDASGREVWRWSAERMFAQATGREVLGPGESVQYEARWKAGGPGRYTARGWLTATGRRIEPRTEFEIS